MNKITKLDAAISASIGVGLAIIFHALLLLA